MKMFKEMTVKGIFSMPPPAYICTLQKIGKNKITIRNRENISED
jgi:hypothetical protein